MSGAWLPMVATRVALPLTLVAVLMWALTPLRAAACALFLLLFLLVMIPLALAIKDNDVHRRREIARIRGLGPKGRGGVLRGAARQLGTRRVGPAGGTCPWARFRLACRLGSCWRW